MYAKTTCVSVVVKKLSVESLVFIPNEIEIKKYLSVGTSYCLRRSIIL